MAVNTQSELKVGDIVTHTGHRGFWPIDKSYNCSLCRIEKYFVQKLLLLWLYNITFNQGTLFSTFHKYLWSSHKQLCRSGNEQLFFIFVTKTNFVATTEVISYSGEAPKEYFLTVHSIRVSQTAANGQPWNHVDIVYVPVWCKLGHLENVLFVRKK